MEIAGNLDCSITEEFSNSPWLKKNKITFIFVQLIAQSIEPITLIKEFKAKIEVLEIESIRQ